MACPWRHSRCLGSREGKAAPGPPPPVPQGGVDDLGDTPKGIPVPILGESMEDGSKAVVSQRFPVVAIGRWLPGMVFGVVFACAIPASISILRSVKSVWWALSCFTHAIIGTSILTVWFVGLIRDLLSRTTIRVEEGSLHVEREVFGKRFGKAELHRLMMRHTRMP